MDKDIKAILLIIECQEILLSFKKRFPKNKSWHKLIGHIDRMNLCYFNAKCFDDTIEIGEYLLKLNERFERFWFKGERYFKYKNKNKPQKMELS